MQFVITKEYDNTGSTVYRLYRYNFWFKIGFSNPIESKWIYSPAEDQTVSILKDCAIKYARTRNKEAEIIEIFGVDE